jgi:GGDEF domain-containing protein
MAVNNPLRTALIAVNLVLLLSWVWLASGVIALPVAVIAGLILAGIEVLLWRKLTEESDGSPRNRRSADRIVELIGGARSESRKHSIREERTGLYNRWYLEMRAEQEALRCDRYGHSMAVIVVRAGSINLAEFSLDTWQTQSAIAAERCLKVVRNIDLSAFLAPLEFAICLIQCDRAGAELAVDRLREEMTEYSLDAGVAVYPEDGCESLALIDLARVRSRHDAAAQGHTMSGLSMASGE